MCDLCFMMIHIIIYRDRCRYGKMRSVCTSIIIGNSRRRIKPAKGTINCSFSRKIQTQFR